MQQAWRKVRLRNVNLRRLTCRSLVLTASIAAAFSGCSGGTSDASRKSCASNEAIACRADSGCFGYKHCNADGSGYGPCDCTLGSDSAVHGAGSSGLAPIGSFGAFGSFGLGGAVTSSSTSVGAGGTGNDSSGVTGGAGNNLSGASAIGGASAGAAGAKTSKGLEIEATGGSPGSDTRRARQCDADGNCKCLNLALFGARAKNAYGVASDGKSTSNDTFDVWLAEKTSASVFVVEDKPELSVAYLNGFDVILLQDLRKWAFSPPELQNLAAWVKDGGGLIALNGYFNDDDAEVTVTNQVLAFSGMSFEGGAAAGSVPAGVCPSSAQQFCPQATASCCFCWNNVVPIVDLASDHPVMKYVSALGAYMGRSVKPGDGTVLGTFSLNASSPATPVAATKTVGAGRVLLWCDDWITYTKQWAGGQTNPAASENMLHYEACYDSADEHWLTADWVFQTKQFWYNLISYVEPAAQCSFTIDEPEVDNWVL